MNSHNSLWHIRQSEVPLALANNTHLCVKKAQGSVLIDINDKQYIDFAAGIGSMNIGHNHPKVVKAIIEQTQNYIQPCFHIMVHEPYLQLAKKLNSITPGEFPKQTMLCNSGAEAVENAIKVARFSTGRSAIICFDGAFHGRTFMSMSLTAKVKPYKYGFGELFNNIYRLAYPNVHTSIEKLKSQWQDLITNQVAAENIAAIIIEPQLGEGGFIPASIEAMQYLRTLCDQHGIVFIADEIQSGFCRTGKMFAMEHYHVAPDILVMGKSLASGLPLSALTARKSLFDKLPTASLGGTNSGNPIACAAALASLEVFEEENLAQKAQAIGQTLREFFIAQRFKHHFIGDIRGLGAMIGIEFINDKNTPNPDLLKVYIKNLLDEGLILLSSGRQKEVLRLLPPLNTTDAQLEKACNIMEIALNRTVMSQK
ncbi:aspartate aminotransferase family protein [Fastidiosibacter lacustris]|uniref:aspartate aminotransferase family protein n=1 Tax=Fastidiosibacter lacustris TaxID=2056695 RepID=UPI000E351811|nr:aspartate aminotransferase family protein [Fastidiosibacter lacustris]